MGFCMRNLRIPLLLFSLLAVGAFASLPNEKPIGVINPPQTTPPSGGGGGGGGSGGAGGDVYFSLDISATCAGEPIRVGVRGEGMPVAGAEVKLYRDTGPLLLISSAITSDAGKATLSASEEGKYLVRAISGGLQESTLITLQKCGGANLSAPTPGGSISFEGLSEIILRKTLSWGSGFAKEVTVERVGNEIATKIVLSYEPPDGGEIEEGYLMVDSVPQSIASNPLMLEFSTQPASSSEQLPITFAFTPKTAGRSTATYYIRRQLSEAMIGELPEPKLQKSLMVESEVPGGASGIPDQLLAAMRGVKNFFLGSQVGMILGLLIGGLAILFVVYRLAFRKQ